MSETMLDEMRAAFHEGRLDDVVALWADASDYDALTLMITAAAFRRLRRIGDALMLINNALEEDGAADDRAGILVEAGAIYLAAGMPARAEAYLRECLGIKQTMVPRAYFFLGLALRSQGKYKEAVSAYLKSAEQYRSLDESQVCAVLQNTAWAACLAGDAATARQLLDDAAGLCQSDDDRLHQALGEAQVKLLAGTVRERSDAFMWADSVTADRRVPDDVRCQAAMIGYRLCAVTGRTAEMASMAELAMALAVSSGEIRLISDAASLQRTV